MVTIYPRVQVTETPELRAALEDAGRFWPGVARSQLVTRLALLGSVRTEFVHAQTEEERHAALDRLQDLPGEWFPSGYLETLREEWHRDEAE